ncbi:uncharacterized protein LOC132336920 [Haemorhous mexicanus]|uniref:uncharacterized protein LOC132336920 n=1 Tax=Haemorhous mexicanus TaxID=30427 RepID=UPI0028BDE082|nr:uncharacterized protein LOC132336920 [Haemorhous mexicanus]
MLHLRRGRERRFPEPQVRQGRPAAPCAGLREKNRACQVCHAVPCRAMPLTRPGPQLPVSHSGINVSHLGTKITPAALGGAPLLAPCPGAAAFARNARHRCAPGTALLSQPVPEGPGGAPPSSRPRGRCSQPAGLSPQECGWSDTEIRGWIEFTGGVRRENLTEALPHEERAREHRAGAKVSNKSEKNPPQNVLLSSIQQAWRQIALQSGRRGWMLARSLGDRSRGILNGNPNTELPGAPGLAWRSDLQERLSLAPGAPRDGRPSAAPRCHLQLEEQPVPWDTSLTRGVAPTSWSFPLFPLLRGSQPHHLSTGATRVTNTTSSSHHVQGWSSSPVLNKGL